MSNIKYYYAMEVTRFRKKGAIHSCIHRYHSKQRRDAFAALYPELTKDSKSGFFRQTKAISASEANEHLRRLEPAARSACLITHVFPEDRLDDAGKTRKGSVTAGKKAVKSKKGWASEHLPRNAMPVLERFPFLSENLRISENDDLYLDCLVSSERRYVMWKCDKCGSVFSRTVIEQIRRVRAGGEKPGAVLCRDCSANAGDDDEE